MFRRLLEEAIEEWQEGYYFSGEVGTQGEGYLLEKLEVAEGILCEELFGQAEEQRKKYSSAALVRQKIIAVVSGASLFKTEVLWGEVTKLQKAEKSLVYCR